MPRIKQHGHDPINKACDALKRLASRVYQDDPGRENGCRAVIDETETLIMRGDYVEEHYNPYQALADRLKQDYPEVWRGDEHTSGARALAPWKVS